MKRFLIALLIVLASVPALARTEKVVADVSSNFVAVSVGFNGTTMLIFGALKIPADVAVIIEGPPARAILRPKVKKTGIWINGRPTVFEPVPGFYAIASSKPVEDVADAESVARYGLNLASLHLPLKGGEGETKPSWRAALLETRKAQRLFQEKPSGVRITGNSLFRADFDLPADMPIGMYMAHIYLLKNKKVIAEQTSSFTVAPVGIEASLYNLAHTRPFSYALLALALSLGLGGAGAYVFRRSS